MAKLGNLASRALVAVVALPILLVIFYQDRPIFTWGFIFAASLIAMYEYFSMWMADKTDRMASLACGAAACAALYWMHPTFDVRFGHVGPTVALVLAVIAPMLYFLFRFGDMKTAGMRMGAATSGIVYAGFLLTIVALIKRDFGSAGGDLILFVLLATWAGDTGAYFAGRFLGKSKLYEAVSPKKTWAGAIGGLCASVGVAAAFKVFRLEQLPWADCFAMAIPGAILGQMGDLSESIFKRSSGVKDSGAILPGHGGILDRVDAVLFMAPYVYLYLWLRPAFL